MKKILTLLPIIALLILCSCKKEGFFNGFIQQYYFLTTEVPDSSIEKIEEMTVGSNNKRIVLSVKAIADSTPLPSKFHTASGVFNKETQRFDDSYSVMNSEYEELGQFYTIYSTSKNGEPVLVVTIDANESTSERTFLITAYGEYIGNWMAVGLVQITQEGATSEQK